MKNQSPSLDKLLCILLVCFVGIGELLFTPQTAQADTLSVTNTLDSGAGSLRQAIQDAVSGDTIQFNSELSGGTILLSSTLVIDKNLTIDSSALPIPITISGLKTVTVIQINSGFTTNLTSLRIIDGYMNYGFGGGIDNEGTLTLTDCFLSGNTAVHYGGGIYNLGVLNIVNSSISENESNYLGGGIYNRGELFLTGSTLSDNRSKMGGSAVYNSGSMTMLNTTLESNDSELNGGVIHNTGNATITKSNLSINGSIYGSGGVVNDGRMSISETTFIGNISQSNAGVIYNTDKLTMKNCVLLSNNSTFYSGGIHNMGSLNISDSTLSGNFSEYESGGITNYGTMTIQNTKISDNDSEYAGGGIENGSNLSVKNSTLSNNESTNSGGAIHNEGTLNLVDSTLIGNYSHYEGGGVFNESILNITNSTISGNTATYFGGGIYNSGTLDVINSTFSGNEVTYHGGISQKGAGIANSGIMNYSNTLIANSLAGGDCANFDSILTNSNNLVEDGSCVSGLSGDPNLGPLADNGGFTKTHALLEGSPAIDAGDNNTCSATDQRGVSRPLGGKCDIGAFEFGYITTAPIVLSTNSSPMDTEVLTIRPSLLKVAFNKEVKHDGSISAANSSANYLLVSPGPNLVFDSTTCKEGLSGDDVQFPIGPISYDTTMNTAQLVVNNGAALPKETYRLFICGTTSITDVFGLKLNDGLRDTLLSFIVRPSAPTIVPETGFPVGRITRLAEQPSVKVYVDNDLTLDIPVLGVKETIVGVPQEGNGWDVTWLGSRIGYLEGSAFPTWVGNTVLTGHVWDADNTPGIFAGIKTLKFGDLVKIHGWHQVYTYEVRESKQILPTDLDFVLKHEENNWVTLVTCQGYNEQTGSYRWRTVVRAVLINVTAEE